MEHSDYIKDTCARVFDTKRDSVRILHRLMGGRSNFTYVIAVGKNKYTFRIPGKRAEAFVERGVEKDHLELSEPLEINNRTVHFDLESGVKIAEYIEGVPMDRMHPYDYLCGAADIIKKIHRSGIVSPHDYAPFRRLERYEGHLDAFEFTHDARYKEYKRALIRERPFLEQGEKTFVHGDAQLSNFVVAEEKVYLTDWEFAGQHDPFHDIACFGNDNFDHAIAILPVYLERTPRKDEYRRLYLWRLYQALMWHNVALFKGFIGLSEDLAIDFSAVAEGYLDLAESLLSRLE